MNEDQMRSYFKRIAEVGAGILTLAEKHKIDTVHRYESPNPYDSRIEPNGGALLVMDGHFPVSILTPLGKWKPGRLMMYRPDNLTAMHNEMVEKFGLVQVVPQSKNPKGPERFGPIYAITKDLEGNPLPIPNLNFRPEKLDYEANMALWSRIAPDFGAAISQAQAALNPVEGPGGL